MHSERQYVYVDETWDCHITCSTSSAIRDLVQTFSYPLCKMRGIFTQLLMWGARFCSITRAVKCTELLTSVSEKSPGFQPRPAGHGELILLLCLHPVWRSSSVPTTQKAVWGWSTLSAVSMVWDLCIKRSKSSAKHVQMAVFKDL